MQFKKKKKKKKKTLRKQGPKEHTQQAIICEKSINIYIEAFKCWDHPREAPSSLEIEAVWKGHHGIRSRRETGFSQNLFCPFRFLRLCEALVFMLQYKKVKETGCLSKTGSISAFNTGSGERGNSASQTLCPFSSGTCHDIPPHFSSPAQPAWHFHLIIPSCYDSSWQPPAETRGGWLFSLHCPSSTCELLLGSPCLLH
jgi:hypothetical protein